MTQAPQTDPSQRNDSLANLIDNKNVRLYDDSTASCNDLMSDTSELKRSQRDILKLARMFLNKLYNGNTEQLL